MKFKQLTAIGVRFHRCLVLGSLALALTWLGNFSSLSASAVAVPIHNLPVIAASSGANQVKGQIDKVDRAVGNVKDKLDSASKDAAQKAKEFASQAKGKAQKNVASAKADVKDVQSAAKNKAKQDISKTQEASGKAKAAVASRAKQDASSVEGALEKAGNKAEEFASNALDTAKNILGQ